VTGIPWDKKVLNVIWCPLISAIPATVTFAAVPRKVIFPPKQAPIARAHHRGVSFGFVLIRLSTIGIIVAVRGAAPTIDDMKAEIHIMSITNKKSLRGPTLTKEVEISFKSPASFTAPITM